MLDAERHAVVDGLPVLAALTPGRSGNLSARRGDYVAITPTGVRYDDVSADDVPLVSVDGDHVSGDLEPSSELPLHLALYDAFDVNGVVHVHSSWATTLAVLREPLPPVHYAIARAGTSVPVADYATYGTEALAANVVDAMRSAGSLACLLSNHGLVAAGASVTDTIEAARAVESTARVYCQARALGEPTELSADEVQCVADRLERYGPPRE